MQIEFCVNPRVLKGMVTITITHNEWSVIWVKNILLIMVLKLNVMYVLEIYILFFIYS